MGNIISISVSCDSLITRCWDSAAGQADYGLKLEQNLEALTTEVAELKELRNDVMTRVKIAEDVHQLKRLEQVQGWLSRAEAVINGADLLIAQSSSNKTKKYSSCMGLGGSTSSHFSFGKQIAKKLQDVKNQKSKGVFEVVADKAPVPLATMRPSEPTVGLESTFDKVWTSLEEERVGIIGLYGMGGVGKTTLLNQINNKFLHTPNDFDFVIWLVASQDLRIEKFQDQIGRKLGFHDEPWKDKRVDEKAADIFRVLCERKFALLLDDLWSWVDLTTLGVPLPTQDNGSKIILTTRLIDVCFQMGAHKKIKVECLPPAEALKLFELKVGEETLDRHPDIRKLAEKVVEECAGLPLALITIGRAMASKKTPQEWEYAIDVLRRSAASVFPGVGKEMYPKLKFSYDCLPNDTVRSCFLYCSLYPEDYLILKHELIDCWIGEGFLDVQSHSGGVQNQGYYIIGCLVDACLLEEEARNDRFVKMHDVIRDLALWIASDREAEDNLHFVQAGLQLTQLPEAEKWNRVRRVSLIRNGIENLTATTRCPNLRTLLLMSNKLKEIDPDFFKFMPTLGVLDLSFNRHLKEIPVTIAKLVSLQYLNVSHTGIRRLPVELKALKNLKCLKLETTMDLQEIPRGMISSLSQLQVLRIYGYGLDTAPPYTSGYYEEGWLVEELQRLKSLNLLTISLKSETTFRKALASLNFQNITVQSLMLGFFRGTRLVDVSPLTTLMQHLHFLALYKCQDLEQVKIAVAGCNRFQSLRAVNIAHCSKLKDATWVVIAPQLRRLSIFYCQEMEQVMDHQKLSEVVGIGEEEVRCLFSKLGDLTLHYLPELKTIFREALPFPQLESIDVKECPKLRNLSLNSTPIVQKGKRCSSRERRNGGDNLNGRINLLKRLFFPLSSLPLNLIIKG